MLIISLLLLLSPKDGRENGGALESSMSYSLPSEGGKVTAYFGKAERARLNFIASLARLGPKLSGVVKFTRLEDQ